MYMLFITYTCMYSQEKPPAAGMTHGSITPSPDDGLVDRHDAWQRAWLQQRLLADDDLSLQALEIALLVCCMLVDDEHVAPQAGEDEAKVELA